MRVMLLCDSCDFMAKFHKTPLLDLSGLALLFPLQHVGATPMVPNMETASEWLKSSKKCHASQRMDMIPFCADSGMDCSMLVCYDTFG